MIEATNTSLADLNKVASQFSSELKKSAPFVVWMFGQMGAGKTTFTGYLLRSLGLAETVPVLSPTYTYMNEYKINDKWYAHLDLYRADQNFNIDALGILDVRTYEGIFIEWPERIQHSDDLEPTHKIEIKPVKGRDDLRDISLSTND